jgi:predicted nucleic acid-binding Zn ribbon protein
MGADSPDTPAEQVRRWTAARPEVVTDPVTGPLRAVRINDGLDRLVRSLGWADGAAEVGVLAQWAEIVGEAIATHARPTALEAGTLVVAVDDTVWASQIRWLERKILDQLAAVSGVRLERLVVRVVPRS